MRPLLITSLALGLSTSLLAQAHPATDTKPAKAETPAPKVKLGDTAPDFTLKDQARKEVTLSSFRGKKNVVLAFYVFAFTGG